MCSMCLYLNITFKFIQVFTYKNIKYLFFTNKSLLKYVSITLSPNSLMPFPISLQIVLNNNIMLVTLYHQNDCKDCMSCY